MTLRWLAACMALCAAAPLAAEPDDALAVRPGEVVELADWSVACDNLGACEAVAVSRERARFAASEWGEMGLLVLRIERERADAPVRLFLDESLWGGEVEDRHNALTLHVLYPGDDYDRTGPAYHLLPLAGGRYEVAPADVAAFLTDSAGTDLAVTRDGDIASIGSTDGLLSVLHYMDLAQAQAPAPSSAMPPITGAPLAFATPPPSAALSEIVAQLCGGDAVPDEAQRSALTNGDRLWRIACEGSGAAANPHHLWFIDHADGRRSFPRFPVPEPGGDAMPPALPNSTFDPDTGILTAIQPYSAAGDCGWWREYQWYGAGWRMRFASEMPACMGVMPEGWLTVWRSTRIATPETPPTPPPPAWP